MHRFVVAAVILSIAGLSRTGHAEKKPVAAVFEVEARNVPLGDDTRRNLTSYIAAKLSESGEYEVVPQERLKAALTARKKDSFRPCYDESCQIEIGQELAANKAVATQVMKVGSRCVVTCTIYDLRKATSGRAATAKGACDEDGISSSIDDVLLKLSARPAAAPAPVQPTSAPVLPAAAPSGPRREGWGMGGAVLGFAAAGVTLALAGAAEGLLCHESDLDCNRFSSIGLGAAALVTLLVSAPIVAVSGSSERTAGVPGILGLRIAGWVLYGLVAVDAVALLGVGIADLDVPHGPTVAAGLLGAGSLILFAVDAMVSRAQARRLGAPAPRISSRKPAPWPVVMPFATGTRLQNGATGALLGVAGAF